MFAFLKPQLTVDDDPLQSPATACAWLRCLPPQDVAGRQRQVLTALSDVRRLGANIDCDRIAAFAVVDAAIDADRRRLIAQYVATVDRSAALAERVWQSMDQINQAFIAAYRIALEAAFARPRNTSYQSLIPLLLARLIRCFGTDGKLRTFRYQRWIPAKWRELHQCYRHAQERGIERLPLTQNGSQPEARCPAIEQEYLCVLLDHRIDTGNLSPAEFDTMSERLRDWSGDLALDTAPSAAGGFVVDIEGKTGLVRWTGGERGAALRFVDTTPLVARFRHEMAALKWPRLASREAEERERQCPIAILDKTWPAIATTVDSEVRRHPRQPAAVQVTVCVGIAHVYDALAAEDGDARLGTVLAKHYGNDTLDLARPSGQRDTRQRNARTAARYAPNEALRPLLWNERATPIAVSAPPNWAVVDRSATGLRLRAPAGAGQGLTVGALVAVRPLPTSPLVHPWRCALSRQAGASPPSGGRAEGSWMLGAVRRVCRMSCEIVEVGVSIFADRVVAATLHSQCAARDDMHFVVDGVDVSAMGANFRGLYIPPKTQPASSSAPGTLIIATSNYDTGRRVLLATDDEMHTLVLREPIEQHADWTWTTIEVAPQLRETM